MGLFSFVGGVVRGGGGWVRGIFARNFKNHHNKKNGYVVTVVTLSQLQI